MGDELRGAVALTRQQALRLLSEGEIEAHGLIPWSSNATILVTVRHGDLSTLAIYKPERGERPLWDFAHGTLGRREVAAYLLCEALGWGFIPPTVLCSGPYGPGSLQLFVHAREDAHFFTIQDDPAYADDLKRLAAFDVVANNADRKSGHCLVDGEGRLWAIDNALTFHEEYKLRTVIWDFAGQPLPAGVRSALERLRSALEDGADPAESGGPSGGPGNGEGASASSVEPALAPMLGTLLSQAELAALRRRVRRLLRSGRYPQPGPGRAVPWPLV